jgi:tRNA (mo5U34)-methyltransferase
MLDVGGNAGYFSLQMKLRGAGRCVLVEPIEEFAAQARFVFSQFKVDVKVVVDDVHTYCLTGREHFDYVLFLGLLYHLRYPLLVLDRLAEMTRVRLVLQSMIIGSPVPKVPGPDADLEQVSNDGFPRLAFVEYAFPRRPHELVAPELRGARCPRSQRRAASSRAPDAGAVDRARARARDPATAWARLPRVRAAHR